MKKYGANLYALNALGEAFVDQTVKLTNFRGPPIVGVVTTFDPTDPDMVALVDFAAFWQAPLVCFDRSIPVSSWETARLLEACRFNSKFSVSNHFQKFDLPINRTTLTMPLCGPWVAIETGGPATTIDAWEALGHGFARTGQNHPYVCGMQGVSLFDAFVNAPPLYAVGLVESVVTALARLKKKWSGDAVPSVSQYQALGLASSLRPGLARLCNPALIPELVLAQPV